MLKEKERLDDLELKGLKIIQNEEGFCFGVDAVLLANLTEVKKGAKVLDMGTGTGIIPFILYGKNQPGSIYGIEIQEEVAEMCRRSVALNHLEDHIHIIQDSILNWKDYFYRHSFDVITCNPPYKKKNTGIVNENDKKMISRHEYSATLEDFIQAASELLNSQGKFFMIHRPQRLADIFKFCERCQLAVKKLTFIHGRPGSKPDMVIVKAIKLGREELLVDTPIYIYDEQGNYTEEIHRIYGKIWEGRTTK